MSRHVRIRLLIVAAVAAIAAAVWLAGDRQRVAADQTFAETQAADEMAISILEQEAALTGYVNTGRRPYLRRYVRSGRRFELAAERALAGAPVGEDDEREAIARQRETARGWQELGDGLIAQVRVHGPRRLTAAGAARLSKPTQAFHADNEGLRTATRAEGAANRRRAGLVTVSLILLLSGVFAVAAYVLIERRTRRDERRARAHEVFTDTMQLARTESEAHTIVKRHLERIAPGTCATILNRNNSANRLEATTPVAGNVLQKRLECATPESCMAIRGGRMHQRKGGSDELISCEVCGALDGNVTCMPSLVGGEVIGSVLVMHPKPLDADHVSHLSTSIVEASPIIANLRNLAIAEVRASTDALTGLPNHRTVQETVMRMVAQAGRTVSPLAAILFDLDNFKQINDVHGHPKGDEALAAIGDAVAATVRGSDFVGRYGGEEFLALLPGTDRDGAMVVAESLRAAITRVSVPGIARTMTASFGVAVVPDDAGEADQLVRAADRALYTAKSNGRDRVEVAATTSQQESASAG